MKNYNNFITEKLGISDKVKEIADELYDDFFKIFRNSLKREKEEYTNNIKNGFGRYHWTDDLELNDDYDIYKNIKGVDPGFSDLYTKKPCDDDEIQNCYIKTIDKLLSLNNDELINELTIMVQGMGKINQYNDYFLRFDKTIYLKSEKEINVSFTMNNFGDFRPPNQINIPVNNLKKILYHEVQHLYSYSYNFLDDPFLHMKTITIGVVKVLHYIENVIDKYTDKSEIIAKRKEIEDYDKISYFIDNCPDYSLKEKKFFSYIYLCKTDEVKSKIHEAYLDVIKLKSNDDFKNYIKNYPRIELYKDARIFEMEFDELTDEESKKMYKHILKKYGNKEFKKQIKSIRNNATEFIKKLHKLSDFIDYEN